ncbi:hypothetical protein [Mycolicibacterium fortuitum]|uniref:hypothetical protein n=1 Tax=Mycolicibacterium fortuitum TaxID=1766 RepID=UPI002613057E|nr:hypothetical protein [Mycolicibacterium fortuitum]
MNTCEDETKPLGAAPDIDTLGAIRIGTASGILSAADAATATKQLAERQTHGINAVRELHYTVTSSTSGTYCHECFEDAPCPTIRALDEAGA